MFNESADGSRDLSKQLAQHHKGYCEWSVMQLRADPVPIVATLMALRREWSVDAETVLAGVLALLMTMTKIMDHIPDEAFLLSMACHSRACARSGLTYGARPCWR
jgi:hypothetical protein